MSRHWRRRLRATPRALVFTPDFQSPPQFGPNIRAHALARELSRVVPVTLALRRDPQKPAATLPEFDFAETRWWDRASAGRLLEAHDIVVSQGIQYPARHVVSTHAIQVFDLYDPILFEHLAAESVARVHHARRLTRFLSSLTRLLLARGDYFLCASPQQRDLWLGGLYAAGRFACATEGERNDPASLIGVVPFGHAGAPPVRRTSPLRGTVPRIGADDFVLLWGGGIWNWFDPELLVRTVAQLAPSMPHLRLYFFSTHHPSHEFIGHEAAQRTVSLARELGLAGRHVFFNDRWVPFDERDQYLLDADVAVCTAPEGLENHFSFRTRLVDAVWAGLPIICTRGGAMADTVEREGLGRVVPGGNRDELARAIRDLADPAKRAALRTAVEAYRPHLTWPTCAAPLMRYVERVVADGPPRPRDSALRRWWDFAEYKVGQWVG